MEKIKAVCLDIDQTLLDFNACAYGCIKQGFQDWNLPMTESTFETFKTINDGLWLDQERKILDHETFLKIRWNRIFEALGFQGLDGQAFEKLFRQYLNESCEPVRDALQALDVLSQKYPLYIASNGPTWQQSHRLEKAGMLKYFKRLFTSEEFGVQKPDPYFYESAYEQMKKDIPDLKKDEILMIGDSLNADVNGSLKAGWKTIWFGGLHDEGDYLVCDDWKQTLQQLGLRLNPQQSMKQNNRKI